MIHNSNRKALVNSFIRLIKKGQKTIDEVPENLKDDVLKGLETAPDPELREGEFEEEKEEDKEE